MHWRSRNDESEVEMMLESVSVDPDKYVPYRFPKVD